MMKEHHDILYAEDESTDAFLFGRALRLAGVKHRLVVVSDGQAAIEYLDTIVRGVSTETLPELVLLDVNMPGIGGLEVLQWIRNKSELQSMITLMFSSSNCCTDVENAYSHGANGYMVKPANVEGMATIATTLKENWLTHNRVPLARRPSIDATNGRLPSLKQAISCQK